ncbi:hypothetical protein AOLI_G00213920 [Acnodon oligacanthus]
MPRPWNPIPGRARRSERGVRSVQVRDAGTSGGNLTHLQTRTEAPQRGSAHKAHNNDGRTPSTHLPAAVLSAAALSAPFLLRFCLLTPPGLLPPPAPPAPSARGRADRLRHGAAVAAAAAAAAFRGDWNLSGE